MLTYSSFAMVGAFVPNPFQFLRSLVVGRSSIHFDKDDSNGSLFNQWINGQNWVWHEPKRIIHFQHRPSHTWHLTSLPTSQHCLQHPHYQPGTIDSYWFINYDQPFLTKLKPPSYPHLSPPPNIGHPCSVAHLGSTWMAFRAELHGEADLRALTQLWNPTEASVEQVLNMVVIH